MCRMVGNSDVVDENLDMTEVELDFKPPLLHRYRGGSVMTLSKVSLRYLASRGVVIRSGRWSRKENSILIKNWYNFLSKHPISNPVQLIGLYEGQQRLLEKFIEVKKFYFQLGKNLNDRTLSSIYARARKVLDPWNYKGTFSNEEAERLLQLHQKFGNKWTKIAVFLNRPAVICRGAYEARKENYKHGAWAVEEDATLWVAVNKYVKSEHFETLRGYPWKQISNDVPGRSAVQCRNHWLSNLCWKTSRKECPVWSKRDSALLICLMHFYMVEDDCYIDWDLLFSYFKGSAVSYATLQNKWSLLKSQVPNFREKDHESVVIYLYKNYLPEILDSLHMSEGDLVSVKRELDLNIV